jgi:hypothetical protein
MQTTSTNAPTHTRAQGLPGNVIVKVPSAEHVQLSIPENIWKRNSDKPFTWACVEEVKEQSEGLGRW